jgi:ribosomal protein L21
MFAVVRTGGKQYRVTAGDKIVVEKLAGEAGDSIDITDILLAGEGSDLKPVSGLVVGAEIVAQAKADKVTVFKKRRRHNYRRKKGHRQQHTILKIVQRRKLPPRRLNRRRKPTKPRRQKMLHLLRPQPRRVRKRSNSSWHIRKQAAPAATVATVKASAWA